MFARFSFDVMLVRLFSGVVNANRSETGKIHSLSITMNGEFYTLVPCSLDFYISNNYTAFV